MRISERALVASDVPVSLRRSWGEAADLLAELWQPVLGTRLEVGHGDGGSGGVTLGYDPALAAEGYHLSVGDVVELAAAGREGLLHGIHTLWQLLDQQARLPLTTIDDAPELAWRELRHERHGGFYSQDDIRRIVAHADRHGIVVVPEIDLPGHVGAALAAYPAFAVSDPPGQPQAVWGVFDNVLNLRDDTLHAFRAVLSEVVSLFPSLWVHLGGDECPTTQWAADPSSLQRMREVGLNDVGQIQGWLLGQVATVLQDAGRRVVGWDELLDGDPPPDALIMAWRDSGQALRAARARYEVVMAAQERLYLDRYQVAERADEPLAIGGVTTLQDVYAVPLVPPEATDQERARFLGAQVQMWGEYTPTAEAAAYMIFPRLCAFAENAWGSTAGGYDDFLGRLPAMLDRLDLLGLAYRPLPGPHRPDAP